MTVVLILAALFTLLLARVPVAFALGGLGLVLLIFGGFSPLMAPQAILSTLDGFILLAVPLFLLMANVLLKGGVGGDLFAAVNAWVGHWPGGTCGRNHRVLCNLRCHLRQFPSPPPQPSVRWRSRR